MRVPRWIALCLLPLLAPPLSGASVTFDIRDGEGKPLPCRIHLKDSKGKPLRPEGLPFWRDHFVCPGEARLTLPAGEYTYEVERGPEFRPSTGRFTLTGADKKEIRASLERLTHLSAKGWYAGDLHIHRPVKDVPLLMRAEDLHIGPVITWWNNRNQWAKREPPEKPLVKFDDTRFYHVLAGEDERGGGALLYFNRARPLDVAGAAREHPSPLKFVREARKDKGTWIDIEKPFWWDVPTWVAAGAGDSIGIANNHMCRSTMLDNEAWGRPRDKARHPSPRGNGSWTQEIYYHLLNCGVRLPPSAGSASGVLPNPVGYNRVYVHIDGELTWEKWWRGLRAGQSFVTNGPLLLCKAGGQLPGHVFKAGEGKTLEVELEAWLRSNDKVTRIEIVQDGQVVRPVPVGDTTFEGSLGKVRFTRSGWFLVRAFADNKNTYRFASSAPFYVEVGGKKATVHERSARFFLDWVEERMEQLRERVKDAAKLREVLAPHEKARAFWEKKLAEARGG